MMHPPSAPPALAVTMGDPCGIGPEIILKAAWVRRQQPTAWPIVIYGDLGTLQRQAHSLALPIRPIAVPDIATALRSCPETSDAVLPVLECSNLPADLPLGQVDLRAGQAALSAIEHACHDARRGAVAAMVTAPIHKEAIARAGVRHPGHTEILAEHAGVSNVRMMLVNPELRTVLVTLHEPLQRAITNLTEETVLQTILLAQQGLTQLGLPQGRIAVAGLNPHAGEHGLLGLEEQQIITPAITRAQSLGIHVSGPWPGDTIFMRARGFQEFDLVIAMYHDQGLIPLKYLGLDTGVNITLGLPFIRTSVDHGTAFDRVGQGRADPGSLLAALGMAEQLARHTPRLAIS